MSCCSVACSLFSMLFSFPSLCFSCLFICFFGFLWRKWHIFSTSTPPKHPSSKTQTLQERSVSPTASSLLFTIGLQTALNFCCLLTGPSDVCICTTARKWKESLTLCCCYVFNNNDVSYSFGAWPLLLVTSLGHGYWRRLWFAWMVCFCCLLLWSLFFLLLFVSSVMWSLLKDELSLMRPFLLPEGLDKQEKYRSYAGENRCFVLWVDSAWSEYRHILQSRANARPCSGASKHCKKMVVLTSEGVLLI